MSILSVIQSTAAKVGIDPVPTSVFSNATRTSIELRETANECASQIVQVYDWNALAKIGTITGDGVTTEYPLSTTFADFGRMVKNAELWTSNNTTQKLWHIGTLNEWLEQSSYPLGWQGGTWTVFGNTLYINSGQNLAFNTGEIARFGYISKNYAQEAGGALKSEFTADSDTFVLDERLLKLNMIWNWKSAHGQPYAQEFEEYEIALEKLRIADRTPGIIRSGRYADPFRTVGFA